MTGTGRILARDRQEYIVVGRTGPDWTGLDWTRLDRTRTDQTGVGLD